MQTHIFTGVIVEVDRVGRLVGAVAFLLHFLSLGLPSNATHSHSWLSWHGDWYLALEQILSNTINLLFLAVIVLFLDLPSNMFFVLFQLKWYIANISTMTVYSIQISHMPTLPRDTPLNSPDNVKRAGNSLSPAQTDSQVDTSSQLASTCDSVWPGFACTCVDLRWLALTLVQIEFARKSTQVFHRLTTQPKSAQVKWRPLTYYQPIKYRICLPWNWFFGGFCVLARKLASLFGCPTQLST